MRVNSRRWIVESAVIALTALTACSGDNIIRPGNQLEVTNATDDFQWQVSNLRNVTQTLTYDWANTTDSANVNQASIVSGGSATLTIRAPSGIVVYQSGLENNGTFHSQKATAGTWRIEVALNDTDGTLNFRVQRAP